MFEDIYGPNGLVLSSDDVTLTDRRTRRISTARFSRISGWSTRADRTVDGHPASSPASGFTYEFDSATGTFVRSTRSFGPILSDRAQTIGQGRIAFL